MSANAGHAANEFGSGGQEERSRKMWGMCIGEAEWPFHVHESMCTVGGTQVSLRGNFPELDGLEGGANISALGPEHDRTRFNAVTGALVAQSAGNAGVRPAASRVASAPGRPSVEVPLQPVGDKRASLPRVGAEGTGGMGGEAAVCPYLIQASHPQDFIGRTVDYIEQCRKKKKAKLIVQAANSLFEIGREEEAKRLWACGNWFQRFNFPCGSYKLVPYPCDSPFCPDCANRRARPFRRRLAQLIQQSKHDYWHLTVTVRNWPRLTREHPSELIREFAQLREGQTWREYVTGGVYSLEALYYLKSREWHPHFHVLIETPRNSRASVDFQNPRGMGGHHWRFARDEAPEDVWH